MKNLKKSRRNKQFISFLVAGLLLFSLVTPGIAEAEESIKIERFERYNPVYSEVVEPGTDRETLGLPDSLRAVVSLSELDFDPESFVQAEPIADMSDGYTHYDYYYYGYVAPGDSEELYADKKPVIYTIYYADQENSEQVGELAYRMYGSVNGGENMWFACDEEGMISGVIQDVPVVWNGDYDEQTEGEYTFDAEVSGYTYSGARPEAKVYVEKTAEKETTEDESYKSEESDDPEYTCGAEIHCTCDLQIDEKSEEHDAACPFYIRKAKDCHCGPNGESIDADNYPWAHQEDCIYFSPVECMCREQVEMQIDNSAHGEGDIQTIQMPGEFSHIHDPNNIGCPLYGKDTVNIEKMDADSLSSQMMGGTVSVMAKEDADRIAEFQEKGSRTKQKAVAQSESERTPLYPALGNIRIEEDSVQNGAAYVSETGERILTGENDTAGDKIINTVPTSGNEEWYEGDQYGRVPGAWLDYITTHFHNNYAKWDWAEHEETDSYNDWKWSGKTASENTGDVTTNPKKIPVKKSGVWDIYSGEQLYYAIEHFSNGEMIRLRGNLDLNGYVYNWPCIDSKKIIQIESAPNDNKTYKIYNLGSNDGGMLSSVPNQVGSYTWGRFTNIEFHNARVISTEEEMRAASILSVNLTQKDNLSPSIDKYVFEDLSMKDSVLFNTMIYDRGFYSSAGAFGYLTFVEMTRCSTQDSLIFGGAHIAAVGIQGDYSTIKNCYAIDSKIYSRSGHSGGLYSCLNDPNTVTDSFTAVELYGAVDCGGISAHAANISNCYSTGKVEGYRNLGGFAAYTASGSSDSTVVNNCYSTALVGIRTDGDGTQGGFIGSMQKFGGIHNCYAAGETGNGSVNMNNPLNIGGFIGESVHDEGELVLSNCYYDKQTTAMREWAIGNSKELSGVQGVLTSDTINSEEDTIHGMTGTPGDRGKLGFTGFDNNNAWVFHEQQYPQLAVFANASSDTWKSADVANMVKAYSVASTATVFLDTWDKGYDWDERGVRTKEEVTYDRDSGAHAGGINTYDTVREITSDFTISDCEDHENEWAELVEGGTKTEIDGEIYQGNNVKIDIDAGTGTVEIPGVSWFEIRTKVEGQVGKRPLRLISLMTLDAGENHKIRVGDVYDHRADVRMQMMDQVVDNLVIGMDDEREWAKAASLEYPNSKKYYDVQTEKTDFSISKNALLRTEIWSAKQNADGSYVQDTENKYGYVDGNDHLVPEKAVKVTGPGTGEGNTLDEQKWIGQIPMYPDSTRERKYIIAYYWILEDGRYRRDYKVVTVEPGEYTLDVNVKNMDDTANSSSLYPAAAMDDGKDLNYQLPNLTTDSAKVTGIPFAANSSAAWKKRSSGVQVKKMKLELHANDKNETLMGMAEVKGDIKAGTEITVPTTYYYTDRSKDGWEETKKQVVDVTYTVAEREKNTGEYYLRFNKLANVPDGERENIEGTNDENGIEAGNLAYINDTQFDAELTLWVDTKADFAFTKTDKRGEPLAGAKFVLYKKNCQDSSHQHDEEVLPIDKSGNLLENTECFTMISNFTSDDDGKVDFTGLEALEEYRLIEYEASTDYVTPGGQWRIVFDEKNSRFTAKGIGNPPAFEWDDEEGYKIKNYKLEELPSSGGRGIAVFVAIGIAVMILGGGWFVYRYKKKLR